MVRMFNVPVICLFVPDTSISLVFVVFTVCNRIVNESHIRRRICLAVMRYMPIPPPELGIDLGQMGSPHVRPLTLH